MRTTLDIDDAVLAAARALASAANTSIGAALSTLARQGLAGSTTPKLENGIPVFTPAIGAPPITLDLVNEYRDG